MRIKTQRLIFIIRSEQGVLARGPEPYYFKGRPSDTTNNNMITTHIHSRTLVPEMLIMTRGGVILHRLRALFIVFVLAGSVRPQALQCRIYICCKKSFVSLALSLAPTQLMRHHTPPQISQVLCLRLFLAISHPLVVELWGKYPHLREKEGLLQHHLFCANFHSPKQPQQLSLQIE